MWAVRAPIALRAIVIAVGVGLVTAGCAGGSPDGTPRRSGEQSRPHRTAYERCVTRTDDPVGCESESGSPAEQFIDLEECLADGGYSRHDCDVFYGFDPGDAATYGNFVYCVWEGGYDEEDCATIFPTPDEAYQNYQECEALTRVSEICAAYFEEELGGGEIDGP